LSASAADFRGSARARAKSAADYADYADYADLLGKSKNRPRIYADRIAARWRDADTSHQVPSRFLSKPALRRNVGTALGGSAALLLYPRSPGRFSDRRPRKSAADLAVALAEQCKSAAFRSAAVARDSCISPPTHQEREMTIPMPPEPTPPPPMPDPVPWHDPGPPVREQPLPPNMPSPGIPVINPDHPTLPS
jgi:hypothetical protein